MNAENNFDQTFADCLEAAEHPEKHILVSHMWENSDGGHNYDRGLRQQEIDSVLEVMAGEQGAIYDDTNYIEKDNFPNRVQHGHPEAGMIGIATCPVTKLATPLFYSSPTGLLLKDPTPVFVSYSDTQSHYYDSTSTIAGHEAWDERINQFINFTRNNKGEQSTETFAVMSPITEKGTKLYEQLRDIVAGQFPEGTGEAPPYLFLDPLSPTIHQKARAAYAKIMGKLAASPDLLSEFWLKADITETIWPEADVNATLDNAVGIVVNSNKGSRIMPVPDGESPNWTEILSQNRSLTTSLYKACIEHAQLVKSLRKHGKNHTPTIVIYQPGFTQAPLVHFPPTQQNKILLDSIMRDRGSDFPPLAGKGLQHR